MRKAVKPNDKIISERQALCDKIDELIAKRDELNTLIDSPAKDYETDNYKVVFKRVTRKLDKNRKIQYLKSRILKKTKRKSA